jgi:two-component system phosphate regulon sensor histidine kinase PhoR
MILLVLFEFLWLRSAYEKSYHDFRKETNMLFRNTVMAIRDSVFMKNIEPISADSIKDHPPRFIGIETSNDSVNLSKVTDQKVEIQIFSADSSFHKVIPPLASRIRAVQAYGARGEKKGFIIRMMPDTLNLDTLHSNFRSALQSSSLDLPFVIQKMQTEAPPGFDEPLSLIHDREGERRRNESTERIYSDTVVIDAVRINPLLRYAASIWNVREMLIKQIRSQILFSLFLTLITGSAFIVTLKSIHSQQRLMQAKNDFISNMSHELKTPVATVSVALEALKNFKVKENPKLTEEYIDIAQRELSRLTLLTDKILKTTVAEDKNADFHFEEINLKDLAKSIIDNFSMLVEKKNGIISFQTRGENFVLVGGAIQLSHVIYNLLDNALKYSDKNPHIEIVLSNDPAFLILSVKDNGMGIAKEYHKKIFEKFFRVPTGDIHNIKGYGLGLNYVSGIVKRHSGTIAVKSSPGEGSEFIITLPRNLNGWD